MTGWGRVRAADAHDAGRAWGLGEESGQLIFMMVLGRSSGSVCSFGAVDAHDVGRASGEEIVSAVDTHDPGRVWCWGRVRAGDAHDAGRV